MGAAYNTRPIYLFALVGLIGLAAVRSGRLAAATPRWMGIAAVLAGILAVSLPQWIINQRTHGVSSPAVQSLVHKRSIFSTHLVWGLAIQRYETTVSAQAPAPTVFYLDPAGDRLFQEAARHGDLYSLPYYLQVVAQHPLDFLALYTRHAINGLDVRDGIVYTVKPSPLRIRTALFNFLVLTLACWVAWSIRSRSGRQAPLGFRAAPAIWPLALGVLLLPVVTILPGAVETRFFLPLHLLAYGLIAFHLDGAELRDSFRKNGPTIVIAALISAGLFFAVSLSTMTQLQYSWPRIYSDELPPR